MTTLDVGCELALVVVTGACVVVAGAVLLETVTTALDVVVGAVLELDDDGAQSMSGQPQFWSV